jgi:hypothetical protein
MAAVLTRSRNADAATPPGASQLPSYYSNLLHINGKDITPTNNLAEDDGLTIYSMNDGALSVQVRSSFGSPPALVPEINKFFGDIVRGGVRSGAVIKYIDAGGYRITISSQGLYEEYCVMLLPHSVLYWIVKAIDPARRLKEDYYQELLNATNRWRWEQAVADGNVIVGRWIPQIYNFSEFLIKIKASADALTVLKSAAPWAVRNYKIQIDIAELSKDSVERSNAADIVLRNAEDISLRKRAASIVKTSLPDIQSLPNLDPQKSTGLRVVVIALEDCDLGLAKEASVICEKILNVPVEIVRLPTSWRFSGPERVWRQRDVQSTIVASSSGRPDFTDWTKAEYISALEEVEASKPDCLSAFRLGEFIEEFRRRDGQLEAGAVIDAIASKMGSISQNNSSTMYVGLIGRGLYIGDANYAFSGWKQTAFGSMSVLSYDMMLASNVGDAYESRPRAAQRLAKEMVPAALKSLRIPRPNDPTDPYAYAESVAALDQKGLELSASTRQALDKFRGQ